ncbi:salivary C-type lectin 2-like [Rhynchophorus ferrugineus]|uniref:salivary C-type lectin 2-like n=1 Tax=Rhynchophorus ferrugineus TaxID=354439 RepID=UPI003FCE506E
MKRSVVLLASFVLVIAKSSVNRYVVSNQRVTFHEGYIRCLQYGLEPAEILSESDEKEIEAALEPLREIGFREGFWIFASNLPNKTNFYWLNSKLPLFYSFFSAGQPDNTDKKENCLEIYQLSTGVFGWNDCPCESKIRFICQRKKKDIIISSCNDTHLAPNGIS